MGCDLTFLLVNFDSHQKVLPSSIPPSPPLGQALSVSFFEGPTKERNKRRKTPGREKSEGCAGALCQLVRKFLPENLVVTLWKTSRGDHFLLLPGASAAPSFLRATKTPNLHTKPSVFLKSWALASVESHHLEGPVGLKIALRSCLAKGFLSSSNLAGHEKGNFRL